MNELNLELQRFADGAAGDAAAAPGLKEEQAEAEDAVTQAETLEEALTGKAEETNEPVPEAAPEQTAPTIEERLAALKEALSAQREQYAQREQDLALRQHFSGLEIQAEAMKEAFPDFDLRTELSDSVLPRLTSPMVGLSVEDAYYAIHHREITEAGAQAAAEMIGNSMQAERSMPNENGSVQRGTPEGGYKPLADLSPEERKMRIYLIRSGKLRFD